MLATPATLSLQVGIFFPESRLVTHSIDIRARALISMLTGTLTVHVASAGSIGIS